MNATPNAKQASRLAALVKALRSHYGAPVAPPMDDPYLLLLWEQVAYLGNDDTRLAAWRLLEERVGTRPQQIVDAPVTTLRAITRRGGSIAANERAERLRAVARRVLGEWQGDLRPVLRLPLDEARRELQQYPSIGESGAERILLLTGAQPVLGLDSHALRVLLRLGYGREEKDWGKTYRSAQAAAERELSSTVAARRTAFLLLRHHGQALCRRSAPRCVECPLRANCPAGGGRAMSTVES